MKNNSIKLKKITTAHSRSAMMSSKEEHHQLQPPPIKKLRFRGDLNFHYFDQRIEEVFDDVDRRKLRPNEVAADDLQQKGEPNKLLPCVLCVCMLKAKGLE